MKKGIQRNLSRYENPNNALLKIQKLQLKLSSQCGLLFPFPYDIKQIKMISKWILFDDDITNFVKFIQRCCCHAQPSVQIILILKQCLELIGLRDIIARVTIILLLIEQKKLSKLQKYQYIKQSIRLLKYKTKKCQLNQSYIIDHLTQISYYQLCKMTKNKQQFEENLAKCITMLKNKIKKDCQFYNNCLGIIEKKGFSKISISFIEFEDANIQNFHVVKNVSSNRNCRINDCIFLLKVYRLAEGKVSEQKRKNKYCKEIKKIMEFLKLLKCSQQSIDQCLGENYYQVLEKENIEEFIKPSFMTDLNKQVKGRAINQYDEFREFYENTNYKKNSNLQISTIQNKDKSVQSNSNNKYVNEQINQISPQLNNNNKKLFITNQIQLEIHSNGINHQQPIVTQNKQQSMIAQQIGQYDKENNNTQKIQRQVLQEQQQIKLNNKSVQILKQQIKEKQCKKKTSKNLDKIKDQIQSKQNDVLQNMNQEEIKDIFQDSSLSENCLQQIEENKDKKESDGQKGEQNFEDNLSDNTILDVKVTKKNIVLKNARFYEEANFKPTSLQDIGYDEERGKDGQSDNKINIYHQKIIMEEESVEEQSKQFEQQQQVYQKIEENVQQKQQTPIQSPQNKQQHKTQQNNALLKKSSKKQRCSLQSNPFSCQFLTTKQALTNLVVGSSQILTKHYDQSSQIITLKLCEHSSQNLQVISNNNKNSLGNVLLDRDQIIEEDVEELTQEDVMKNSCSFIHKDFKRTSSFIHYPEDQEQPFLEQLQQYQQEQKEKEKEDEEEGDEYQLLCVDVVSSQKIKKSSLKKSLFFTNSNELKKQKIVEIVVNTQSKEIFFSFYYSHNYNSDKFHNNQCILAYKNKYEIFSQPEFIIPIHNILQKNLKQLITVMKKQNVKYMNIVELSCFNIPSKWNKNHPFLFHRNMDIYVVKNFNNKKSLMLTQDRMQNLQKTEQIIKIQSIF